MMERTLTGTPADLITYQRELVRTHNFLPLGRINKIAFDNSATWQANEQYIRTYGRPKRFFEFRNQWLPLAQSHDRTQLLVPAPMMSKSGVVGLPEIPDPTWKPEPWTEEELGYRKDGTMITNAAGRQITTPRPIEKDMARMIPQRLEDMCERGPGGRLEGTNFMVFQPVINVVFQPEKDRELVAQMWTIEAQYDQATQTHMALLVDPRTGETFFFGGRYDIVANEG